MKKWDIKKQEKRKKSKMAWIWYITQKKNRGSLNED